MAHKKTLVQLALLAGVTTATGYTVAPWVHAWNQEKTGSGVAIVEAVTPGRGHSTAPGTGPLAAVAVAVSASAPELTRVVAETRGEAFVTLSWLPPPPPVVIAPPAPPPKPAPPMAPPLPFTFVGLLEKGAAHPLAFVAKGEALLVVAAGDTIDNNTYRVDVLNAEKIVLTYLPMGIQQTLNISRTTQ